MDQIILVQTTFVDVTAQADRFSTVFYEHLFEVEPKLRTTYASDSGVQGATLVDEFGSIVASLGQLPTLMERATELGRRHGELGVQLRHHDLVLDATLIALRSVLEDRMTTEVETAWRRAYNLTAEMVLHGAGAPTDPFVDYD